MCVSTPTVGEKILHAVCVSTPTVGEKILHAVCVSTPTVGEKIIHAVSVSTHLSSERKPDVMYATSVSLLFQNRALFSYMTYIMGATTPC